MVVMRFMFFVTALIPGLAFTQANAPLCPAQHAEYFDAQKNIARYNIKKRSFIEYEIIDGKVTNESYKRKEIRYNPNGSVNEVIYVDKENVTISIIVFSYTDKGLPKSETEFYPDGNQIGRTVYRYSVKGILQEKSDYNQYGYIISKTKYETTNDEKIIIQKLSSPKSVDYTIEFRFSNIIHGQLLSEYRYTANNKLEMYIIYEYSGENISKEIYYNSANQLLYKHNFVYDENGDNTKVLKILTNGERRDFVINKYNNVHLLAGKMVYGPLGQTLSYIKFQYE